MWMSSLWVQTEQGSRRRRGGEEGGQRERTSVYMTGNGEKNGKRDMISQFYYTFQVNWSI